MKQSMCREAGRNTWRDGDFRAFDLIPSSVFAFGRRKGGIADGIDNNEGILKCMLSKRHMDSLGCR
jgi:hypothetical protein